MKLLQINAATTPRRKKSRRQKKYAKWRNFSAIHSAFRFACETILLGASRKRLEACDRIGVAALLSTALECIWFNWINVVQRNRQLPLRDSPPSSSKDYDPTSSSAANTHENIVCSDFVCLVSIIMHSVVFASPPSSPPPPTAAIVAYLRVLPINSPPKN